MVTLSKRNEKDAGSKVNGDNFLKKIEIAALSQDGGTDTNLPLIRENFIFGRG